MIYVTSDIHGCYDALQRLLQSIQLSDTDTLYILGDLIDRGPDSLKVLEFVRSRRNIRFILGNHEDFLLESLKIIWNNQRSFIDMEIWMEHGGRETYDAFEKLSLEEQKGIVKYFESCPLYEILDNEETGKVVLVHAGVKPKEASSWEELLAQQSRMTLLWAKEDFLCHPFDVKLKGRVLFGHTPTCEIQRVLGQQRRRGRIWKEEKRWGIDGGYLFGGRIICVRLDDWKEYYI